MNMSISNDYTIFAYRGLTNRTNSCKDRTVTERTVYYGNKRKSFSGISKFQTRHMDLAYRIRQSPSRCFLYSVIHLFPPQVILHLFAPSSGGFFIKIISTEMIFLETIFSCPSLVSLHSFFVHYFLWP